MATRNPENGERYRIRVVEKVFDILDAFDAHSRELTIQEIVARTGQTKSGVYRLLMSLQLLSVIERDSVTRRFRIGPKLYALASLASYDIRRLALPHMERLRERFGFTTNLMIPEGNEVVLIEVCDGVGPFRMSSALGSREPVYCTASGKAIVAFMPVEAAEALLESVEFVTHTPHTIRTRKQLRVALDSVQQSGYALDQGEYQAHGRCVAVPVFDRRGAVTGALSISGPETLLSEEELSRVLPEIMDAGLSLSRELGFTDAYPPALGSLTPRGYRL